MITHGNKDKCKGSGKSGHKTEREREAVMKYKQNNPTHREERDSDGKEVEPNRSKLAYSERDVQKCATKTERPGKTAVKMDGTESDRTLKWIAQEEAQLRLEDDAPIAPTVSCNVLRRLRDEAIEGYTMEEERYNEITGKGRSETPRHEQGADDLEAIMKLVKPAMEVATNKGTKRQKGSLLRYWGMYCATYPINSQLLRTKTWRITRGSAQDNQKGSIHTGRAC